MFRSGRKWFSIASILLFLVGVAHTIGNLLASGDDPTTRTVSGVMRGARFEMGLGMAPSMWDIFQSLTFTMSIALFWLAFLNLLIAKYDGPEGRVVRAAAGVSVVGVGALVVLYWYYRVPPPLVSFAVVEAAYLAHLVVNRPRPA